jgi:hypothetical protein
MMGLLFIYLIVIIVIVGVAIAYFMLSNNKKGIKDGKYANNPDNLYVIVSKGKVIIFVKTAKQTGGYIMAPTVEFNITKAEDPITIDNKETVVYISDKPVYGKPIFLAQSHSTDNLSFYIMGVSSYARHPEFPEDLRKIE